MAAIKSCHARFPQAHAVLIEDKANGPAIISELQKEIPGVVAVNPEGGKLARAQATAPFWEAGSLELPSTTCAPFLKARTMTTLTPLPRPSFICAAVSAAASSTSTVSRPPAKLRHPPRPVSSARLTARHASARLRHCRHRQSKTVPLPVGSSPPFCG
jgi:hypothetical protein